MRDLVGYDKLSRFDKASMKLSCHIDKTDAVNSAEFDKNGYGKFLSIFNTRMNIPRLTVIKVNLDKFKDSDSEYKRVDTYSNFWSIPGFYNPSYNREGKKETINGKHVTRSFTMGHLTSAKDYSFASFNPYASFSMVNIMPTGLVAKDETNFQPKVRYFPNFDGSIWNLVEEAFRDFIKVLSEKVQDGSEKYEILMLTGGSQSCIRKASNQNDCFTVNINTKQFQTDQMVPQSTDRVAFSDKIWKLLLVEDLKNPKEENNFYVAVSCKNSGLYNPSPTSGQNSDGNKI